MTTTILDIFNYAFPFILLLGFDYYFKDEISNLKTDDIIRIYKFDYVVADFIFLLIWLTFVLKIYKHYLAFSYAFILAIMIYHIDAIGWFNEKVGEYPNGDPIMKREYEFVVNGVVLTRDIVPKNENFPGNYDYFAFSNPYVLMKHMNDFMMLISYALVFFTWQFIMWQMWRPVFQPDPIKARKLRNWKGMVFWTLLFFIGIVLVAYIGTVSNFTNITIKTVRHMTSGRSFRENSVYIGYTLLAIHSYIRNDSALMVYCMFVSCFQSFAMIAGLYAFGIRPFRTITFFYEVLFLVNMGGPYFPIFAYEVLTRLGIYPTIDNVKTKKIE